MAALGWSLLFALLAVAASISTSEAFRVLGFFPIRARSHNIMFKAILEALADRGHEVVMLSPFPRKTVRPNYTDIDMSTEFPSMVNTWTFEDMTRLGPVSTLPWMGRDYGADWCREVFGSQHVRDVLNGVHGKFDIVFTEVCATDCWAVVPHKLNVPFISISTQPDFPWIFERIGAVDNPSYLQTAFVPMAGKMSFLERVQNTYYYVMQRMLFKYLVEWPSDKAVKESFGQDTPSVSELIQQTSLVLVNAHPTIHPARPMPPNMIPVGGVHLKDFLADTEVLEPGLRRWMDEAEHGVVLFTLGSLTRMDSLPADMIRGLVRAFAALPQRVLWKYESDDIAPLLPGNVRTAEWFPQTAVLSHPKTVLFITHGGLMGTLEAMLIGVPMLGIPLFTDQHLNVARYKQLGIAARLQLSEMTEDNMLASIRKLTKTDKYRVRAKEVAAQFADLPMTTADSAVWWTEYVVRHKGAMHLRPLGADMPLYQYLLLDVAALFLAGTVLVLLLLRALLRALLALLSERVKVKEQ